MGEWADFSTPDRATIEREIAEKWKSISDNALSEDDLSSIVDTVMEDGSCDNLLKYFPFCFYLCYPCYFSILINILYTSILNSVAQSKQVLQ